MKITKNQLRKIIKEEFSSSEGCASREDLVRGLQNAADYWEGSNADHDVLLNAIEVLSAPAPEIRFWGFTAPVGSRVSAKVLSGMATSPEEFAKGVIEKYPGYDYLEVYDTSVRAHFKPLYRYKGY